MNRREKVVIFAVGLLCGLFLGRVDIDFTQDRTPTETVEQYLSLLESYSAPEELFELITGIEFDEFVDEYIRDLEQLNESGGVSYTLITNEIVTGAIATVDALIVFGNESEESITAELLLIGGQWLIRYQ